MDTLHIVYFSQSFLYKKKYIYNILNIKRQKKHYVVTFSDFIFQIKLKA